MSHPEFYLSLAAIFVAALSLSLTLWSAMLERKHARLSLLPHLIIRRRVDSVVDGGIEISIFLRNVGLGPARLMSYVLHTSAGQPVQSNHKNWYDCLKDRGIVSLTTKVYLPDKGELLSSNDKLEILELSCSQVHAERNLNICANLWLEVTYESLYGEQSTIRFALGSNGILPYETPT